MATPESIYLDRRQVLASLGLGTLGLGLSSACGFADSLGPDLAGRGMLDPAIGDRFADRFPAERNEAHTLAERQLTPEEIPARYNNFYEFTTAKDRVWDLARKFPFDGWKVTVAGRVNRPRMLDLEDLFTRFPLEERLYRFRCVERWAMQVPWTGYPLRALIDWLEPLSSARYVHFVSFDDPANLPGQRTSPWYPWPYFEALRLDEARHELAFVVVGIYGHALPMQHGAPWRLALPWKYGYKGPKSIVHIEFTKRQPETFWHKAVPNEYGFYSNIDPEKPHPRWSQALEQDIGTGETRPTLLYGGYAEQVASLYTGREF
ncbi:MAG: protein-methionine-sulfoxide reductase catalytic subunit MsrP [Thermoanaerobaculia bacterium]